jgi:hypothetical protein
LLSTVAISADSRGNKAAGLPEAESQPATESGRDPFRILPEL